MFIATMKDLYFDKLEGLENLATNTMKQQQQICSLEEHYLSVITQIQIEQHNNQMRLVYRDKV